MKFGIKEAQAAAVFAKTDEQKQTVLAVVSMLNIPIVVSSQVSKKAKKLNAKINRENTIVAELNKKVAKSKFLVDGYAADKNKITVTSVDWAV